jgi:hypothetical protein
MAKESIGKVLLDYFEEKGEVLEQFFQMPCYSYDIPEGQTSPFIVYEATNFEAAPDSYDNDTFRVRVKCFHDNMSEAINVIEAVKGGIKKINFKNKTDHGNAQVDPVEFGDTMTYFDTEYDTNIVYQDFEFVMRRDT